MKQLLLICAVVALVGCGKNPEPIKPITDFNLNNPILEVAIRYNLKKKGLKPEGPEGKPTPWDLAKVTGLELSHSEITDADLKEVAKLRELVVLDLTDTQITDAGLKEVAKLQKLSILWLEGTQITDAGLKEVSKLQELIKLDLWDTQITDAGLKELAKLKKVQSLTLYDTQVTKAGVAELQKALPKCTILHPHE